MLTVVFLLLLFSLPTIVGREYQTLPLRLDAAINEFRHRQQALLNPDDLSTTFTLDELYAHLLSDNNRTTACEKDTKILVEAALRREMWALKVFDSWGKPLPSGILKGNIYWLGNYDECVQQMYLPNNKSFLQQPFDTQYCLVALDSSATSGIALGACLPSSCDRLSIAVLIQSLFKKSNFTEDRLRCSSDAQHQRSNLASGAVVTCLVLSLLGLLVLTGTVVDVLLPSPVDSSVHLVSNINNDGQLDSEPLLLKRSSVQVALDASAFFAEFSALRTLNRIFTTKTNNNNDSFTFINGIRVLALFWVIFGHSFSFGANYTSNLLDVVAWSHNLAFQLILSGQFSVDTFFVLSGFLTAIIFVRETDKQKLSFRFILLHYVHRYIRLTPTFLLVVLVSINLTPYFGNGPAYPFDQGFEATGCRHQWWWTSILYISNLVQPNNMCLPVSWFLQNDMQFHWLAPLALIPFVMKRKSIAFGVVTLFVLVSIGSTIGLLLHYPYMTSSILQENTPNQNPNYFNTIYITPWCRISAYAVGLLTGFILIHTGRLYHLNRYLKLIGSLVAILFVLACMFTTYTDYVSTPGMSRPSRIAYEALSRPGWSLAVGWLLFLCSTNQGSIVNRILSWPVWSPLARLNYSAYLIHTMIIFITLLNQRSPTYYHPLTVINTFVSNLFFSYLAALVVCIFCETPFFIIEKKLFKR